MAMTMTMYDKKTRRFKFYSDGSDNDWDKGKGLEMCLGAFFSFYFLVFSILILYSVLYYGNNNNGDKGDEMRQGLKPLVCVFFFCFSILICFYNLLYLLREQRQRLGQGQRRFKFYSDSGDNDWDKVKRA